MAGMIIIGYPGIGKTSVSGKDNIVDLESSYFHLSCGSSKFFNAGVYCDLAIDLYKQGYIVCVSSHEDVRKILEGKKAKIYGDNLRVVIIYPKKSLEMKWRWLERLEERYNATRMNPDLYFKDIEKDYRAFEHVKENYMYDIDEIMKSPLPKYELESTDYNLADVIRQCEDAFFNDFFEDNSDTEEDSNT